MNVSLPQIATHSMPTKTLPNGGKASEKFSMAFADAQETADSSTPEAVSGADKHLAKKIATKTDKGNSKLSAAADSPALPKAISALTPAVPELKAGLASTTHTLPGDEADEPADGSSAATSVSDLLTATQPAMAGAVAFGSQALEKSPVSPEILKPAGETSAKTAADTQAVATLSTNQLNTWTAREADTNLKGLIAPIVAGSEGSATPNGKLATAGSKEFGNTTRSTASALESKPQADFTFLQSHTAPTVPPTPVAPQSPNSESRREMLQSRPLSGTSTGKEKAGAQASSEASKKDFDGAQDQANAFSKGTLPSNQTPSGNHNSDAMAAAGSVLSSQFSSAVSERLAGSDGSSPKASGGLPHSPSTATAEDAEAAGKAGALTANSPLHTAKLIASMERSELHVGLRAGEFGNVDIRTSLARNQFTAEISVERGELGRALAAELPSLHHRLSEQHLPAANITVQDNAGGGTADFQQGSRENHRAATGSASGSHEREDSPLPLVALESVEPSARLDIHM